MSSEMAKRYFSVEEARRQVLNSDYNDSGDSDEQSEGDPDYDIESELRHGDDLDLDRNARDAIFTSDDTDDPEDELMNPRKRGRPKKRPRVRSGRGGRMPGQGEAGARRRGRVRMRGGTAGRQQVRGRVRMRGGNIRPSVGAEYTDSSSEEGEHINIGGAGDAGMEVNSGNK